MQAILRPAIPEVSTISTFDDEIYRTRKELPLARVAAAASLLLVAACSTPSTETAPTPPVATVETEHAPDSPITIPLGSVVRIEEQDFGGQGGGEAMPIALAIASRTPGSKGGATPRVSPSANRSRTPSSVPLPSAKADRPEYQVEYCVKGNTPDRDPTTVAVGCMHVDVPRASFEAGVIDLNGGPLTVHDLVTVKAAQGLAGQID